MRFSNYESASVPAFVAHSSLYLLNAGVPVRIAEMRLAEPATTLLAVLGGRNHARFIPERNALAEYRARLRGDRVEGCHLCSTFLLLECGQTIPPFSYFESAMIFENSLSQARQRKSYRGMTSYPSKMRY